METRTETISPIQGSQVEGSSTSADDDDDDDAPAKRTYTRLPLYLETAEVEIASLVNPEETDRSKMRLARIPSNYNSETHRIRRADFLDETFFLEMRANSKEAEARALLAEVEAARKNVENLRKLPLDQRQVVAAYQKGQAKMAKLAKQMEALGLSL